jgi:hypothetical protein
MSQQPALADNPMQAMRRRMLECPPAEFGIAPSDDYPDVYGLIMEWPIDEHTASVVALCDGNASLYTTSTFGVIGGFGHESVRRAAGAFVHAAAQQVSAARPASAIAPPSAGRVQFLLLTFGGVKIIEAALEQVLDGNHALSALFFRGQDVLTQLRRVTQTRQAQEPTTGQASGQRWSGAAGYLNCLLTLLCETDQRVIELVASRPVPNLVALAAGNSESRSWIEAQGFDYAGIESKKLMELLKQSTNVKGLSFTTRQALLPTIHVQANARRVARVFEVSFRPFGWSVRIERLADTDARVVALQRETDARNRPEAI